MLAIDPDACYIQPIGQPYGTAPPWETQLSRVAYDSKPTWYPWSIFSESVALQNLPSLNARGKLATEARRSGVDGLWRATYYVYDDRGRVAKRLVLTEEATPEAELFTYRYDRQGRIVRETVSHGRKHARPVLPVRCTRPASERTRVYRWLPSCRARCFIPIRC